MSGPSLLYVYKNRYSGGEYNVMSDWTSKPHDCYGCEDGCGWGDQDGGYCVNCNNQRTTCVVCTKHFNRVLENDPIIRICKTCHEKKQTETKVEQK